MRLVLLIAIAIPLAAVVTAAMAQSQFESSKMSSGVVLEGAGVQSSKLSSGIVLQNTSLQSSKMSIGIVLESTAALQSSKFSTGIVLQTISGGGGVVPRAPLTHW